MALCFVVVKTSNAILILDSLYMVFSPFLSVFMNFFVFSVLKFQSYALMLPFYLFSGFMVSSSVWKFMFLSFENFPWNNYLVISYFSLSIFSAFLEHPMLNFVDQISAIFPLCTIPVFSVPLPGKVLQIYFSTLLLVFFMSTVIFTFSKNSF